MFKKYREIAAASNESVSEMAAQRSHRVIEKDVFMTMSLPTENTAPVLLDNSHAENSADKPTNLHSSESEPYNGDVSSILLNGSGRECTVDINRNRSTTPVGSESSKQIRPLKHGRRNPRSEDEDEINTPAPINDVYRQRQQKKIK